MNITRHPDVPEHLFSLCIRKPICYEQKCPEMAKLNPQNGRWYITMGHCGFNSRINNCNGYESKQKARQAVQRHGGWVPK